jgi:uncharacterized membrane-anchored protein YhcB (DUF1043 family)
MSSLTLLDGNLVGIIVGVSGAVVGVIGLWSSHRANKIREKLDKERLELDKRKHEWEEKEHTQKEIDTLSQLRKDPEMSIQRHLLYDAYYEFMNTQSKGIFQAPVYHSSVHNILEEMEGLGGRLRRQAIPLDRFSDSDWKVIMYCYEAIEPYNEEYKKNDGNDYYGEDYRYLVDKAKEYWQEKDPKRTFKPPRWPLSD